MEINEWKWNTNDGLEMYSKEWLPAGNARGVVCLIHGLGEHQGRYHPDGEALTEAFKVTY
jgi:alpha-beta hydrolase superfamily lysophospholipase